MAPPSSFDPAEYVRNKREIASQTFGTDSYEWEIIEAVSADVDALDLLIQSFKTAVDVSVSISVNYAEGAVRATERLTFAISVLDLLMSASYTDTDNRIVAVEDLYRISLDQHLRGHDTVVRNINAVNRAVAGIRYTEKGAILLSLHQAILSVKAKMAESGETW